MLRTRQAPPSLTLLPAVRQQLAPHTLRQLRLGPALHGDALHELDLVALEAQLALGELALLEARALVLARELLPRRREAAFPAGEGGAVGGGG